MNYLFIPGFLPLCNARQGSLVLYRVPGGACMGQVGIGGLLCRLSEARFINATTVRLPLFPRQVPSIWVALVDPSLLLDPGPGLVKCTWHC